MDNLDQFFEEWKEALEEPLTKTITLSNLTNKSIMDTFINYENKVNASKAKSLKIFFTVGIMMIVVLLIYSLLTYFRGAEQVTYNLAEMVLGTFLVLLGLGAMMRNIKKIEFPDVNALPTLEYLNTLQQNLFAWRTRERPALFFFVLFIPAGIALLLKSVFVVPFYYIFVPFFLFYLIAVTIGFLKNNPEFNAILKDIDDLLTELKSAN